MKKLWWLSFADPDRPVGQRFLGVCVVEAEDISTAADRAWEMNCNPGGEVRGDPLPEKFAEVIEDHQRNVLLDAEAARELNRRLAERFPEG